MTFAHADLFGPTPTFVGVYQHEEFKTSIFVFDASNVDVAVEQHPLDLKLRAEQYLTHLSIAVFSKIGVVVTGQLMTSTVLDGVLVAVIDSNFNLLTSIQIKYVSKPALFVTECKRIRDVKRNTNAR